MALQWGYKRAFLRCALLFMVGVVLQIVLGDFDNKFLRYPWGLILSVNYLYVLLLIYIQSAKWKWLKQLYDGYASVSSLAWLILLTIIFGLTRQDGSTEGLVGVLGFTRMTSSWIFILILFYFNTALGVTIMRDIHHWRTTRLAALLSHAMVFLALSAAMFGSADKQRVTMSLELDGMTYVGVDERGEEVELPFALTLKKFQMDEYPAKLYIADAEQEGASEDFLLVEGEGATAEIDGWLLSVKQSLEMGGKLPESEQWQHMIHAGASPAVEVEARNTLTGERQVGWVSCGSHIFEPSYLWLTGTKAVVMPRREAKRYLSNILILEQEGGSRRVDIEVNKPARVGSWYIYQMGYNTALGRWSTTSVVECVRDGWWSVVRIALWMILAAGVVMFLTAGGRGLRKEQGKEDKR